MLYLLKSSRVQDYHQQNVAIVGATEGERFEIAYGSRWVPDGLAVERGEGCVIVFADSPYERFIPVRFAVIEGVTTEEGRITLDVRVTALVKAGAAQRVTDVLTAFARTDENRPGKKFILRAENPDLESPTSHEDIEDAWRSVIDELRSNGFFARSTFARVVRSTDEQGRPYADGREATVGDLVDIELELRTPSTATEDVSLYLESVPDSAVELVGSRELPATGRARVRVRALAPGKISTTFRFLPEPLISSRPSLELSVSPIGAPSPVVPQTTQERRQESAPTTDLTPLIRRLRRDARFEPEAWFHLFEDFLGAWAPFDPAVLSAHADAAFQVGEYRRSVELLQKIDMRRPDEDSQLVVGALKSGVSIDLRDLLPRLDVSTDAKFEALLDAVEQADRATLDQCVDVLRDSLGDERLTRLAERLFKKISSLELSLELAERVAYIDPDLGADLLIRKWPVQSAPIPAVRMLIDWGVGGPVLAPFIERLVDDQIERSELRGALETVGKAQTVLASSEQRSVVANACLALLDSADADVHAPAFELLLGVINGCLTAGDLPMASRLSEILSVSSMSMQDTGYREQALLLKAQVVEAAIMTEEFVLWKTFQESSKSANLKPYVSGRVLHLVGGKSFDWLDDLSTELGLAGARWHETEKKKGIDHDWADSLLSDRDVVIVIADFIGHAVSIPVKEKCRRKNVPQLEAKPTKEAVLDALTLVFVPT